MERVLRRLRELSWTSGPVQLHKGTLSVPVNEAVRLSEPYGESLRRAITERVTSVGQDYSSEKKALSRRSAPFDMFLQ